MLFLIEFEHTNNYQFPNNDDNKSPSKYIRLDLRKSEKKKKKKKKKLICAIMSNGRAEKEDQNFTYNCE